MVVIVKQGLSKKSDLEIVDHSLVAVDEMTDNTDFPPADIDPSLESISEAVSALQTALLNKGKGKSATQTIKECRYNLEQLMGLLGNYVQNVANGPTIADNDREGIVFGAGLLVKTFTPRQKQDFSVTDGELSGSVFLIAPGIKRGAHDWEYIVDFASEAWIAVPTTLQANTLISGLTPGTRYGFRHRFVTKDGPSEWHDPIFLASEITKGDYSALVEDDIKQDRFPKPVLFFYNLRSISQQTETCGILGDMSW